MQFPVKNPTAPARPKRLTLRCILNTALCLLMAAAIMVTCTQCKNQKPKETEEKADTAETTTPDNSPAAADPLSFLTPDIPDDGTDGFFSTVDPGVYIYRNMTFEISGASDEAGKDYAAAISEFKQSAPDFTVYNIVAPTHTEFGLPARLAAETYTASQSQNIKTIYSNYTQEVKPINIYNKLCEHKDEYIYFNTDHHWTGLGAYYAYQAFCEQTGQTPLQLSDCTENKKDGFSGTFSDCADSLNPDYVSYWTFPYQTHAMRQEESGQEPYEMSVYYEYIEDSSSLYSTFICGDSSLFIEYNDTDKNGKKIAVVKESYGNAFVPYLTYNYEEVHVIDPRYFTGSVKSYMQENGITEVIFLNNIMSANNPFFVDSMKSIY